MAKKTSDVELRQTADKTMAESVEMIRNLPANDAYKPILQTLVDDLIETMVKLAKGEREASSSTPRKISSNWTKKAAIKRMENNQLLQEILQTEPALLPIIEAAKNQKRHRDYHRIRTYTELRNRAMSFVGNLAQNEQFRTSRHYDAVIHTIDDLLPPDEADLGD